MADTLAAAWDDADALHRLVMAGLRAGDAASVLDGARRLAEIDADRQRSAVALASACLKLGKVDEAEAALGALEGDETATVALLRARCADARDDASAVDAALDRALALDPDHPAAVDWYGERARRHGGEDAFAEAMAQLVERDGGLWPRLRLAKHFLDTGDATPALGLYREVAEAAGDRGEVLMAVCGDLGAAGRFQDAEAIVAPVYDAAIATGPLPASTSPGPTSARTSSWRPRPWWRACAPWRPRGWPSTWRASTRRSPGPRPRSPPPPPRGRR